MHIYCIYITYTHTYMYMLYILYVVWILYAIQYIYTICMLHTDAELYPEPEAKDAAKRSIVLLKNEGHVLPLKKSGFLGRPNVSWEGWV